MVRKYGRIRLRMLRRVLRFLLFICGTVLIFVLALVLYSGVYYHADTLAIEESMVSSTVTIRSLTDSTTVYTSEGSAVGLIFYPGGKVESEAYAPLMCRCAEEGITCVLVKVPLNLAFLSENAADGIQTYFPEIKTWYLAGHSLGGSIAGSYVSHHLSEYEGLILLGSVSSADLSDTSLRVISIRGSEDGIISGNKYGKHSSYLPADAESRIIEGGCHSYFGMYGLQKGDGTPSITADEQISQTAGLISDFIFAA